ncbi:MAG: hypothetical protein IKI63_00830, partial [Clostridia bacterium]|nr:hypothetical protein [Clostridia bacterium]
APTEAPTTVPTTTPTTAETLEAGMEGVGEKTFDTPFFTMTVPADVKYELYTYAVDEDDNRGTVQIDFGPESTLQARFEVSTTRMISSLDDAHDECIRVQNLDTYDEGKYEDMEDVTFGGMTYKAIHVTTEWSDEIFLVSYFKRAADGVDVYVECKLDQDGFGYDAVLPTADFVVAAMNSVVFKK